MELLTTFDQTSETQNSQLAMIIDAYYSCDEKETENEDCFLFKLPISILFQKILPYLNRSELSFLSRTCKKFYSLISDSEILWKPHLNELILEISNSDSKTNSSQQISSKNALQMLFKLEAETSKVEEEFQNLRELRYREQNSYLVLEANLSRLNQVLNSAILETDRARIRLEAVEREWRAIEHQEKFAEYVWEERFNKVREALHENVQKAEEERNAQRLEITKEKDFLEKQLELQEQMNQKNKKLLAKLQCQTRVNSNIHSKSSTHRTANDSIHKKVYSSRNENKNNIQKDSTKLINSDIPISSNSSNSNITTTNNNGLSIPEFSHKL